MAASWNHYCEHGQETTQTIQWPGSLGQIYVKIHAWHQFSHITWLCCPRNRNRICKLFCLKWILIRKLLKNRESCQKYDIYGSWSGSRFFAAHLSKHSQLVDTKSVHNSTASTQLQSVSLHYTNKIFIDSQNVKNFTKTRYRTNHLEQ